MQDIIAHELWEKADKLPDPDRFWFEAEKQICPYCHKRLGNGLPAFAKNATTVCPKCHNVVLYKNNKPCVANEEETASALQERWIRVLKKV